MKNDCENLRIWRITPSYIQMSQRFSEYILFTTSGLIRPTGSGPFELTGHGSHQDSHKEWPLMKFCSSLGMNFALRNLVISYYRWDDLDWRLHESVLAKETLLNVHLNVSMLLLISMLFYFQLDREELLR